MVKITSNNLKTISILVIRFEIGSGHVTSLVAQMGLANVEVMLAIQSLDGKNDLSRHSVSLEWVNKWGNIQIKVNIINK